MLLHCDNTSPTTKKSLPLKIGGACDCLNWKNMIKWCVWLPMLGHEKVSTFASLSICPYLCLCLFQTFPWNSALCCKEVWPCPPGEALAEMSWGALSPAPPTISINFQNLSEWNFRWFQIAAFGSFPCEPQTLWSRDRLSCPLCALSEFLMHRNCKHINGCFMAVNFGIIYNTAIVIAVKG